MNFNFISEIFYKVYVNYTSYISTRVMQLYPYCMYWHKQKRMFVCKVKYVLRK
jgi:hypothetical protein